MIVTSKSVEGKCADIYDQHRVKKLSVKPVAGRYLISVPSSSKAKMSYQMAEDSDLLVILDLTKKKMIVDSSKYDEVIKVAKDIARMI